MPRGPLTGRTDASGEPTHEDRGNLGGTEYKYWVEIFVIAWTILIERPSST